MKATYINLTKTTDDSCLDEVARSLKLGNLVVFPTETVYGIGTNGLLSTACQKIYEAKGRNSDNPLILHVSDFSMLSSLVKEVSCLERTLMEAFFPGPFTLILKKTDLVPSIVTAGLDTVAIRMPSHPIANRLIARAGVPIAAPSANLSGKPSGTNIEDIYEELGDKVSYILDGGNSSIGLESTIVRVIDSVPTILRPGKITKEEIEAFVGKVNLDPNLFTEYDYTKTALCPGIKHRHYAPNTKCLLVYSPDNIRMVNKINSLIVDPNRSLVISSRENVKYYQAKYVLDAGSRFHLEEISQTIFSLLRKVDSYPIDCVFIEGVAKSGIGLAIMNRLIRTCDYQYIEC